MVQSVQLAKNGG